MHTISNENKKKSKFLRLAWVSTIRNTECYSRRHFRTTSLATHPDVCRQIYVSEDSLSQSHCTVSLLETRSEESKVITSSTFVQRREEVSSEVRFPTYLFPFTDKAFAKFSQIRNIPFSSALKIRDGRKNAFQLVHTIYWKSNEQLVAHWSRKFCVDLLPDHILNLNREVLLCIHNNSLSYSSCRWLKWFANLNFQKTQH
jgi:hypothetical protein